MITPGIENISVPISAASTTASRTSGLEFPASALVKTGRFLMDDKRRLLNNLAGVIVHRCA